MITNSEELVKIIDFWQKSAQEGKLHKRAIIEKMNLKGKEVIDLVGPRRSGKSSVLKLIIRRLEQDENFLYINFEDPFFIANNEPGIIEDLIAVFREYFNPDPKYVFLDEIQAINQWEKAVRKLRDAEELKIFVTGSSSKLLSGEISTLLTGRHLSYRVFPLSFREFCEFRGIKMESKKDIIIQEKKLLKTFKEYMQIGGFPEAVLGGGQELLKTYFLDILQKDVIKRHEIRDRSALEKMAVFLLSSSAKTVSLESLKKGFGLSFSAASLYLAYLKDAFLVFELPQFFYSLKKQSRALKKIYAIDTGLANAVSFRFSEDKGRILENIVFLALSGRENEIYYYKNGDKFEVDFLIKEKNKIKELIQVAWSLGDPATRKREIRSLFSAMDDFGLKEGSILTYNEEESIRKEGKTISVRPAYKWLLENI